ncbi:LLM class flavin-dependent oxidoreductase [Nakamurella antarctica]|uniref:LLM class flavin-dependent oxidoreductase n=1 Tax=Nakamurella antarctica TaxID=1902245 RepID=A0A3G8ZNS7_9ACTN|nr:LLM class flavin-dependent oxidoreductase [Nakamurella antarctica]AZI58903.1 LLM class flavin-dependent oxidoreductase [Nakamurella antarctica]
MTTVEIGALFRPQLPPERLKSVVHTAQAAGLDQLWLWEDCFLESGIATAATALAWSETLKVGIGVLPVPFRNAALTAMELATIERLFPRRLIPGIGHGVQDWMAQVGAKVGSPLTLLREHLTVTRALLAGERVDFHGRYVSLADVALDWPPAAPMAVHAAAGGPKTLQLSGECSDGTVLTSGTTPDQVREAKLLIDAGRAIAGRTDEHVITVYLICATGNEAHLRVEREVGLWNYDPDQDNRVAGDAHEVAAGVQRWIDAGADCVVLQPTLDEPDQEGFVTFAAEKVKPLL